MYKSIKDTITFKNASTRLVLLMILAFIIAAASARLYAVVTGRSVFIYGYQIHHFYFGIFLLAIGGVLSLLLPNYRRAQESAAVFIGAGMGLFVDEVGLLLNCTTQNRGCAYFFPDSFDLIGTIAVLFFLLALLIDMLNQHYTNKRNGN